MAAKDAALALRDVVPALAATPLEVATPNYIHALFAWRASDFDEVFARIETALEEGEVDWQTVRDDPFWYNLHGDPQWRDLAEHHKNKGEDPSQLSLDIDDAGPEDSRDD
jgi:hypothetical protein